MQTIEANGARIPTPGLGTMTLKEDICIDIVAAALRRGYRHLDTAQMYGNEREVGEGMRASGLAREDVFLTTKVWHNRLAPGDLERSVDESLTRLQLPYVDLLLIHWPNAAIPLKDTLGALVRVKRAGLTRHIGVANFTVALIEEAAGLAGEPLVTNQIEVHPFIDRAKVKDACRRHGLSVTAYCPIARGKVPGNPVIEGIAKAHGKSAGQVALRWLVQQGVIPIPRTAKVDRLKENLAVFDFALAPAEMAEITALKRPDGRVVNPAHAPRWDD
jgi:diketogulonate reductase-like aldo/keto reductase